MNLSIITDILDGIKGMTIRKMIVFFICIYPIFTAIYFKDEIKLILGNSVEEKVIVRDVNDLVKKTHELKDRFDATAVLVFIYQPKGDEKLYKERVCYSGDSRNVFYDLTEMRLIHYPKLLGDLNNNTYVKITQSSNHGMSKLLSAYNVGVTYIVPIKNDYGLLTAEVMVVFDNEINNENLKNLINSTELYRISM